MARYSFRDPATQVLTAQGFMAANREGDLRQAEADDFALEPGLWQLVNGEWAPYTPPPLPDARAFELALHEIFPGQDFFAFWATFPYSGLFLDAIRTGTWALAAALITMALQQEAITQGQYDAILSAAGTWSIPLGL